MFPLKDDIPTRRFPVLTVAIVVACVLVYFGFERGGLGLGATGNERVVEYGAIPYEVTHPGKECEAVQTGQIACEGQPGVSGQAQSQPSTWITIFTSMFMHGSLLHLGGNMLFLWIFGNNVEDAMGRVRYVVFYLLAGYAATALQTVITLETAPGSADIPNLGASGAISGVLGAYAVLLPRASVLTAIFLGFIFFLREIPAIFFLGVYFVFQVWQAGLQFTHPPESGGVAVFAHLGGFLFGLAAVWVFRARRPLRPSY